MSMYIDFISHKRKKAFMFCFTALHPRKQIRLFPMIFLMKALLEKYEFIRKKVFKRRRNLSTLKEVLIRKWRLKNTLGCRTYDQYLHDKVWKIKEKNEKIWKPWIFKMSVTLQIVLFNLF